MRMLKIGPAPSYSLRHGRLCSPQRTCEPMSMVEQRHYVEETTMSGKLRDSLTGVSCQRTNVVYKVVWHHARMRMAPREDVTQP